jgi:hypothetical protein
VPRLTVTPLPDDPLLLVEEPLLVEAPPLPEGPVLPPEEAGLLPPPEVALLLIELPPLPGLPPPFEPLLVPDARDDPPEPDPGPPEGPVSPGFDPQPPAWAATKTGITMASGIRERKRMTAPHDGDC